MNKAEVLGWVAWFKAQPWSEIKSWIELGLWGLALIAVFWCLARLKMIYRIIQAFRGREVRCSILSRLSLT